MDTGWASPLSASSSSVDLEIREELDTSSEESEFEDEGNKEYIIHATSHRLPKLLEEVDLRDVLNVDVWTDLLSEQEKKELIELLPQEKLNQTLEEIFTGQVLDFYNPLGLFSMKLQNQHYTYAHNKKVKHLQMLYDDMLYRYSNILINELPERVKRLSYSNARSNFVRYKVGHHRFSSDSSSDESLYSINFSGCSSGESTIVDEDEEAVVETTTKIRKGEDEDKEKELKKAGNLDWVKYSSRFKDLNIQKNQLTIRMPTTEWVENYRKQEADRYRHPTLPWVYTLEDLTNTIVAPVSKKVSGSNIKARDHACLKRERAPYITALSVTRDAAARLPDGVGTRADICQLVRESQFISESASDTAISNLVSGALDRLHYERDPCVKYDQERKLWIYLHKDRGLDYAGWRNDAPVKRGRPPIHQQADMGVFEYLPPYLEDEPRKKKK